MVLAAIALSPERQRQEPGRSGKWPAAFAMRASVDPMTRLAFIPQTRNQARGRHQAKAHVALDSHRFCGRCSELWQDSGAWPEISCMSWKTRRIKSPQGALFLLLLDAIHAMNGRAKEPHDPQSNFASWERVAAEPTAATSETAAPCDCSFRRQEPGRVGIEPTLIVSIDHCTSG